MDILRRYTRHAYDFIKHLMLRKAKERLEPALIKIAVWNAAGLPSSYSTRMPIARWQSRPKGCGFP